ALNPWDPALVSSLRAYQESLGATASFDGTEAVIVTGQQPAMFTGPLYTIYKAITAIRLARAVEQNSGVPCVPIFWVGGEDHDFEEARSATFLTKTHRSFSFRYAPAADVTGLPMHRVPLEESLHESIDAIAAELPGPDYRSEMLELLHTSLDASESLADWSARLLARLFRDTPLVFFSPHLPAARALGADLIRREIADPLTTTRMINDAGNALERLDFQPQLMKGETECNFFVEVDSRRRKVVYEKGVFSLPEVDESYSADELVTLLESDPERFSPNVALRCVTQQTLFPVAAYVAGPGEVAYWAQLKPLFERFDVPMPIVYPRAECALTTIKLNKLLRKLGLTLDDLHRPMDDLLLRAMRSNAQNPALILAETERKAIEKALDELADGLGTHDKTAASMAVALAAEMGEKFDRLERTIIQGDEARMATVRQQLDRLCNSLAPGRKPQERVYSIFSFLFEHGWELIPRLLEEMDVESFRMNEIEL
ncbi:MAG: bacillithiol biosynthesis cysteine-adding enzyme BshC, partial [Candidatus Hydrogenedentes bacterium]|nr:bacillithiol biosynthesis cysteine-adding enzyme BshC [Candidatus Hydrogenedentota bacterium]